MLPGMDVGGGGAGAADFPFACSLVGTVAAGCGTTTTKIDIKHKCISKRILQTFFSFVFELMKKLRRKFEMMCQMYMNVSVCVVCICSAFICVSVCMFVCLCE